MINNNKNDIKNEWSVETDHISRVDLPLLNIVETSAKTGSNVHESFISIAKSIISEQPCH